MFKGGAMIRLSPQMRAAIQRTTLPVLVLLTGAIIVLGKADQLLFNSLRTTVTDSVAPVLNALAQPLNAVGNVVDRAKMVVTTYQENVRLEAENARLLQWQQTALNLAADNQQLRGLLKAVPETAFSYVTARVIANSGGAFVRMILINAGGDHRRRTGRAADRGRRPRLAGLADHRPQFARPGDD
jgi:rod shape-determining protein MreC